ncbi:MAG: hypothetical protein P4M02_01995, partial [Clostridia bacterium]|nr:hypothetical protein [Clostridia bacterium]
MNHAAPHNLILNPALSATCVILLGLSAFSGPKSHRAQRLLAQMAIAIAIGLVLLLLGDTFLGTAILGPAGAYGVFRLGQERETNGILISGIDMAAAL